MTIRTRILLFFFLAGTLITCGIIGYTTFQMRKDAESYYVSSSSSQLRLMNIYIENFVKTSIQNATMLAQSPDFIAGSGSFPDFRKNEKETVFRVSDLTPEAQRLINPLMALEKGYDDYVEVYAGFESGTMLTTLDGTTFPPRWDMSKRPWYVSRASSIDDYGLAKAYTSVTGETVFAITHKIKDTSGRLMGVLGIDVSLKGLADKFRELSSGDTGYFVLIEDTGKILCEPSHSHLVGNILGKDITDPGMLKVFNTDRGVVRLELDGQWVQANVLTNAFGWKLISVQTESAIYARSNATMRNTAIITAICGLSAFLGVVLLVRSINRPLSLIVSTATEISTGNLDARLEPRDYYGELSLLQQALTGMVSNLKGRIAEAARHSELAKQETARAQEAMNQADEARRQAENARRDGMLAAASELEGAIGMISAASTRLNSQVEESDHSAADTARHLEGAATAMNEMNATVQEVARNASSAASTSDEMHHKAVAGAKVVESSLKSIQAVRDVSLELKQDMGRLNEQAMAINKIMGVISDIADQTNLLALNAAIEAARAGDAGRGFAVVADEVRKLAEKTMESTHDVDSAIRAIQESTTRNTAAVDNAVQLIEEATNFANESGQALTAIVESVESMADQVRSIATASEQQSATSEEINRSIIRCNEMSQRISETMGDASRAVTDMSNQAQALARLVENLKRG